MASPVRSTRLVRDPLELKVNVVGSNNNYDHSDWANAKVTATASQPGVPSVTLTPGAAINEGGTYTASGSFTDTTAGPWTATVNYGDGSGAQPLTLNADKTFSLSHVYADNGSYSVVVTVSNSSASGQGGATATVNNVAPTVTNPAAATITAGGTFTGSGSFTDPGVNDTWTATVDYGDGSLGIVSQAIFARTYDLVDQ